MAHKTCPMCCSEIAQAARKCPHCHQFQNRAALILYHPATAALAVFIPLVIAFIAYATFFTNLLESGENFANFSDQVTVTNTHIAFGETKNNHTVAILGELQNNSPIPWEEINLHAHFTDHAGRTIDVATEDKYSFHLPAHSTAQFKLSFRREFPETNYVHHTIRILSAKDARSRF